VLHNAVSAPPDDMVGLATRFEGQMRRRDFIALVGGAAAWPLVGRAQRNLLTIGVLHLGSADTLAPRLAGLRQGLAEMGYAENRDYVVEYRVADGQATRLPDLAADLVKRGVALIAAEPVGAALASKAATKDIPIVFGVGIDPVAAGLVNSLHHPGGNATGVYNFQTTLLSKRIALLREVIPTARRWGVLLPGTDTSLAPAGDVARAEAEAAMAALNLELTVLVANTNGDRFRVCSACSRSWGGSGCECKPFFQHAPRSDSISCHARPRADYLPEPMVR
jgi:putative tryptophan/tyrosine transport system substrate-binding protein